MRKFIVFAPPFDLNIGGSICLHKLVHILNELGCEAYITPFFTTQEINRLEYIKPILRVLKSTVVSKFGFVTNPNFLTPVAKKGEFGELGDDWIAVYPETVFGNPLGARNIVRWFLHHPGFHTGSIYYGKNEFHVRFNAAMQEFRFPGSYLSPIFMPLIHYPLDIYNSKDASVSRGGTAYCVRKGVVNKIHHNKGDTLIDGKSHTEIAAIFRRVKQFISYDSYTAYSRFASLCGCDSIVIPEDGVAECEWYPDPADRYGVAYGFDKIEGARESRKLLFEKISHEHHTSHEVVRRFSYEVDNFFSRKPL